MSQFCFVTFEFHPTTPGGCGVFVYNASIALLEAGHVVHILIDCSDDAMRRLNTHTLSIRYPHSLFFHHLSKTEAPKHPQSAFRTLFEWSAYRFNEAAKELDRLFHFDLIEWFDYCGVAYYATRERQAKTAYVSSLLGVRLHNTLEVMDANDGALAVDFGITIAYAMEHSAISGCDLLLSNGRAYFDRAFSKFYQATKERVIDSPPPLFDFPETSDVAVEKEHGNQVAFLFYGRLFTWKGADLLAESAIHALTSRSDLSIEFHFVGYDSHMPPTGIGSYMSYLESKIPAQYRDRFVFHGQLDWNAVSQLLPSISCAVFPNYFESFCYAAHELDACGIPLLLSRIPAFEEFFAHSNTAHFFELSIESLSSSIIRFAEAPLQKTHKAIERGGVGRNLALVYEAALKHWPIPATVTAPNRNEFELLVIRLVSEEQPATESDYVKSDKANKVRVLIAQPAEVVTPHTTWFLGRLFDFHTDSGDQVGPRSIQLGSHLLVCRNSDCISDSFVSKCLSVFRSNSTVGFVGSWSEFRDDTSKVHIDTFAFDALHPIAPWFERDVISRHIVKTHPGALLVDLYDYRLGKLGEAGYLQTLENNGSYGLTIPEALITTQRQHNEQASSIEISHFLIRDSSAARARMRTTLLAAGWTQGQRSIITDHHFSGNVLDILVRLANWLALIFDRLPYTRRFLSWVHLVFQR